MHSEVKQPHVAIIPSREQMMVLQSLYALDVVRMRMLVGVDHLSAGHIIMPQDEVIASRVQIISNILQSVHSLLVVAESPQLELFLAVHHLNASALHPTGKHRTIPTHAQGCQRVSEMRNLLCGALGGVVDGHSPSMGKSQQI